jgi:hypothetical protein
MYVLTWKVRNVPLQSCCLPSTYVSTSSFHKKHIFFSFLEALLERVSGNSSTLRILNISGNSLHQVRGELLADALRWEYN